MIRRDVTRLLVVSAYRVAYNTQGRDSRGKKENITGKRLEISLGI
jgi:hypothetical protein